MSDPVESHQIAQLLEFAEHQLYEKMSLIICSNSETARLFAKNYRVSSTSAAVNGILNQTINSVYTTGPAWPLGAGDLRLDCLPDEAQEIIEREVENFWARYIQKLVRSVYQDKVPEVWKQFGWN